MATRPEMNPRGSRQLWVSRYPQSGLCLDQGYSKYGPRSRIHITKGFSVDRRGPPVSANGRKAGFMDPGSIWKFCNVDPGTKSLSTPGLDCEKSIQVLYKLLCAILTIFLLFKITNSKILEFRDPEIPQLQNFTNINNIDNFTNSK